MKYSFTRRQPAENARSTLPSRSSSVTFLFTTSRMRCVPASGANVSPLFLPPAETSRAISTPNASTRSEGSDTETPVPSSLRWRRRKTSSSWL